MAKKKNLYQILLMNCEEATLLSTKTVYKERSSPLRQLRLWLHNITCPPCKHFHEDNQHLQEVLEAREKLSEDIALSKEKKEEIQKKINNQ